MRICIPKLDGRISPVLDVARTILVLEVYQGGVRQSFEARSNEVHPLAKAKRIIELKPDVVICGAVSQELETVLLAAGIESFPNICGVIDEVIHAFLAGKLEEGAFLMPGCCGQRRRARRGWKSKKSRTEQYREGGEVDMGPLIWGPVENRHRGTRRRRGAKGGNGKRKTK